MRTASHYTDNENKHFATECKKQTTTGGLPHETKYTRYEAFLKPYANKTYSEMNHEIGACLGLTLKRVK